MSESKPVSAVVIRRLPRYYRYLDELLSAGITRISSKELSNKMRVTASQIRQDLNCFGGFGQQGYGYNVSHLHKEIGQILGLNGGRTMVIIGIGNLGKAIAGYNSFTKRGFLLKGLFDSNPSVIGTTIHGLTVQDAAELDDFVRKHRIDIGVLTIPKATVQSMADRLIAAGIKGIWNFSHMEISAPDDVALENVHMSDSLMTLSCKIGRLHETSGQS